MYAKFFESTERKTKLHKIGRHYRNTLPLHTDIMAVLCGLNGGSAQGVIVAVLSASLADCRDYSISCGHLTALARLSVRSRLACSSGAKCVPELAGSSAILPVFIKCRLNFRKF